MFKITDSRGYHMTFKNGLTISVQFSGCSYCDNKDNFNLIVDPPRTLESKTAEVAVWGYKNDNWITKDVINKVLNITTDDDVYGYLTTDQVAKIITYVSELRGE